MAKAKSKIFKGVIVEFDFTVLDGSKLLFDTAKALLQKSGVELTPLLPELEALIMTMSTDDQRKLLAQLQAAQKGA